VAAIVGCDRDGRLTPVSHDLAAQIDALLPQTQCRQCGYPACRPYAEAIAAGVAGINQCAPGGDEGARELASLLNVPYAPVDSRFGVHKPRAAAFIDETLCIGCMLCIDACPVDAIVGAPKLMHTVLAGSCTGCELCIAPCPVDCIALLPAGGEPDQEQRRHAAAQARRRFDRRTARLGRHKQASSKSAGAPPRVNRQIVERAIARAKARLAGRK
jgi:electron transport complex protein RnfB